MGIFGFGKKTSATEEVANETAESVTREGNQVDYNPTNGILNLSKNSILDLTKYSDTLEKVRIAAGWDVVDSGQDYDLDVCAFLLDKNGKAIGKVYYGAQKSKGIYLDGDNLTGEGDGDDENIYANLKEIPAKVSSIMFAVVIYQAKTRRQRFGKVKNAFVRLVDENAGQKEICKFSLSEDGGDNTAVTFAELYRNETGWSFRTIGNYSKDSIESLYGQYK